MLSAAQMLAKALAGVKPLARRERVRVDQRTAGRICAREVPCPTALPAAAISMMDGYAVAAAQLPGSFIAIGFASAGAPFAGKIGRGECVKIATGAWVPAGLDEVVPIENVAVDGDRVSMPASTGGSPSYIRAAGSEISRGEPVLGPQRRISARDVALLCGLGIDRIEVFARPRVAVMSTGDELRQPGATLSPGTIYDSNRPMLLALLAKAGCATLDLGAIEDERAKLRAALAEAAHCDAIITSGAASVGEHDYLKQVVAEMGSITSWQVAIKPGKPFILGEVGGVPLFGLPGNPSSSFVTYLLLVAPALAKLAGGRPVEPPRRQVVLGRELRRNRMRDEYLRCTLAPASGAALPVATLQPVQGSGSLATLAHASCLVRIPHGDDCVAADEPLDAIMLDEL